MWVRSLVRELRSSMLHSMAKINKNKFFFLKDIYISGWGRNLLVSLKIDKEKSRDFFLLFERKPLIKEL